MYRGTTPTLTFNLPISTNTIAGGFITVAQDGRTIIERPMSTWNISDKQVSVTLTQAETLLLSSDAAAKTEVQLRVKTLDGTALASRIFPIRPERILKEGEI